MLLICYCDDYNCNSDLWNSVIFGLNFFSHCEIILLPFFTNYYLNRYEDGNHYMGEHRDDEKDLRHAAPIASVSLGCTRDFVFRHADSRGREAKRSIPPIKLQLEHGSLLVMKYPTNVYWYHALPVRRKEKLPRINLTFRDIVTTKWYIFTAWYWFILT